MYRNILLVGIALTLAGCNGKFVRDTFTSSACGGVAFQGYTATVIAYGDSSMKIIPISKIRPETEFRFVLTPKVRDTDSPTVYKDAWVKVESDHDNAEGNWLEAEGTYNGTGRSHTLVTCVPKQEDLTRDSYKYKVTVSYPNKTDTISYIDPRVIVDVPN